MTLPLLAGERGRSSAISRWSQADTETRERLVGLLWSETEEKARASLRQALHELRRALDDAGFDGLAADKLAVRIDRSRVAVDMWDILEEAQAGRAHPLVKGAHAAPMSISVVDEITHQFLRRSDCSASA